MKNYDFIIIGQGIAGSILGYTLIEKHKQKVLVIDNNNFRSSSKIATGIYNPITGKRRVKTWLADDIFPFMHDFYQQIENKLNIKLLYDHKVYRPFDSILEQNEWSALTDHNDTFAHISPSKKELSALIKDPFGGIEPLLSGWMDTQKFLDSIKYYFVENDAYQQSFFDNNHDLVKEDICQKIIFCEGFQAAHNNLWSWLPWLLAKGEIITINIENAQINNIINKSVFICPTNIQNQYKVGSTFAWENLDTDLPTSNARKELEKKLNKTIHSSYTTTHQEAGIRPTVQSRRPFIGMHPTNKNMGIFNGFGSKCVSLAPYFANQFCEYLLNNQHLNKEVDIYQYYAV